MHCIVPMCDGIQCLHIYVKNTVSTRILTTYNFCVYMYNHIHINTLTMHRIVPMCDGIHVRVPTRQKYFDSGASLLLAARYSQKSADSLFSCIKWLWSWLLRISSRWASLPLAGRYSQKSAYSIFSCIKWLWSWLLRISSRWASLLLAARYSQKANALQYTATHCNTLQHTSEVEARSEGRYSQKLTP